MKIRIKGPLSGRDWQGQMVGWAPNQVVDVPEDDDAAMEWAFGWLDGDYAELVEEASKSKPARVVEIPAPAPPPDDDAEPDDE